MRKEATAAEYETVTVVTKAGQDKEQPGGSNSAEMQLCWQRTRFNLLLLSDPEIPAMTER
jgi:hypothetical protein